MRPALPVALPVTLLLAGCVVRTGLCESSDDCDPAQQCNVASHRCEDRPADADMAAPGDPDLALPDLTPVPPDLSGDLVGTGLLDVQRGGDGAGLVRSDPMGVACGVACAAVFPAGSRVRLTVEGLDEDSFFAGWSGACSGDGDCDVVVSGTVRVGATFKRRSFEPTASGVTAALHTVYGLPPPATGAVFAAGDAGKVLRWNGAAWTSLNNTYTFPLYGAYASAPNNLWVVGAGPPVRWNGTSFAAASGAFLSSFYAVSGTGAANVWAVGDAGSAVRYDGMTWSSEGTATLKPLNAAWGSGPSDLWVVGDLGVAQRWNGSDWRPLSSGTIAHLYGVWGAGPSAVFAVGQSGTILRWDGTRFTPETSPTTISLRAVFGYDDGMGQPKEVWAVGEGGVALRRRAGRWVPVATGSAATLNAVWGERAGELWAVGDGGTILRYDAHR